WACQTVLVTSSRRLVSFTDSSSYDSTPYVSSTSTTNMPATGGSFVTVVSQRISSAAPFTAYVRIAATGSQASQWLSSSCIVGKSVSSNVFLAQWVVVTTWK